MGMQLIFTNNATSRLYGTTPAGSISIQLPTGDGAKFPSPGADQAFMATIEDRRTNQLEIVRCTARTGDILLVERGQEQTAAQDFLAGATVSHRMTAGSLDWFMQTAINTAGYTKAEADTRFVFVGGDVMTGPLTLWGLPTIPNHAANKQYVDDVATLLATNITGKVGEAPNDGKQYARQSQTWQVVAPGLQDAPLDNIMYGRFNAQWQRAASYAELTSASSTFNQRIAAIEADIETLDGYIVAMQAQITTLNNNVNSLQATKVTEAPADGQFYSRKDNAWVVAQAPAGAAVSIADAPPSSPVPGQLWWDSDTGRTAIWYNDGNTAQWVQISGDWMGGASGTGGTVAWSQITGKPATFPPTVPIAWSDISNKPVTYPPLLPISWFNISDKPPTYPPDLPIDWADIINTPLVYQPALPISQDGVTNLPADLTAIRNDVLARVLKTGDLMSGALTLPPGAPTSNLHATHKQYVDTQVASRPGEAPTDDQTYGRRNAAWTVVAGSVSEAPIDANTYGRRAQSWQIMNIAAVVGLSAALNLKAPLDSPTFTKLVRIVPASGEVHSHIQLVNNGPAGANIIVGDRGVAATARRWSMYLGDATTESGANAGSNFTLHAFNDDGATATTVMHVPRNTKQAIFPTVLRTSMEALPGAPQYGSFVGNVVTVSNVAFNTFFSTAWVLRTAGYGAINNYDPPTGAMYWNSFANGAAGAATAATQLMSLSKEGYLSVTDGVTAKSFVATGAVGINVTGSVNASGTWYATMAQGNPSWEPIYFRVFHTPAVQAGIQLIVGTSAPKVWTFQSTGDMVAPGGAYKPGGGVWADSSDSRIKDVKRDYTRGLAEVLKLQPKVFTYKGNHVMMPSAASTHKSVADLKQEFVGLVAQDVEKIFPSMVTKRTAYIDGVKVTDLRDLDTSELIYAVLNSIRTINTRLDGMGAPDAV